MVLPNQSALFWKVMCELCRIQASLCAFMTFFEGGPTIVYHPLSRSLAGVGFDMEAIAWARENRFSIYWHQSSAFIAYIFFSPNKLSNYWMKCVAVRKNWKCNFSDQNKGMTGGEAFSCADNSVIHRKYIWRSAGSKSLQLQISPIYYFAQKQLT